MHLDERTCKLIDEILQKGITRSTVLSDMLERDHSIKLEPHFISEYKYLEITKGRFL
jgi:hypothetical protein